MPKSLQGKKLRRLLSIFWLLPAGFALGASLVVFLSLGWIEYRNATERTREDLAHKAETAARRLAAEILIEGGAVEEVKQYLATNLGLASVSIVATPECTVPADGACAQRHASMLYVFQRIPHVPEGSFVAVATTIKPWTSFLNVELIGWAILPVFAMLILGVSFQGLFLEKYVVKPIFSLVDAAEASAHPPEHWPFELQKIAADLAASFQAREQAVFAMLAKGVIHDLKTLIHSLLTATELVHEQQNAPEKRMARLESLLRASSTNLPKMKRIIELTLDGTKDIPIRPVLGDLIATIQSAVDATKAQATASDVAVTLRAPASKVIVTHDPVQLERALTNLIKNGIEAIPSSTPSSRRVEIGVSTIGVKNGAFVVSVEDSGAGLPPDAGQMFKPTKSTKLHGAGLGLYIVGKIVRGHGGTVRVARSSLLGGARFMIELPATPHLAGGAP